MVRDPFATVARDAGTFFNFWQQSPPSTYDVILLLFTHFSSALDNLFYAKLVTFPFFLSKENYTIFHAFTSSERDCPPDERIIAKG